MVGGIPNLIKHGQTGFLVPPKNPDTLAEHILKIINMPQLQNEMGRRARDLVVKKFSWQVISEETLNIYSKLIELNGHKTGSLSLQTCLI